MRELIPLEIPIEAIDRSDERFRHRYDLPPFHVCDVACLPIVVAGNGPYCIVDGFRRFDALSSQSDTVSVLRIDDALSDLQLYRYTLSINLRSIVTPLDRAYALMHAVRRFTMRGESDLALFADICQCDRSWKVVDSYVALCDLPNFILAYCNDKGYSLKTVKGFSVLDTPVLQELYTCILEICHFTDSEGRILCEMMKDIMARDRCSCGDVCTHESIAPILANEDISSKERGRRVFDALKRIRYPLLTQLHDREEVLKKAFSSVKSAQVSFPDNYERDYAQMTVPFKTIEDLHTVAKAVLVNCEALRASGKYDGVVSERGNDV